MTIHAFGEQLRWRDRLFYAFVLATSWEFMLILKGGVES